MKALCFEKFGGPEVLEIREVPIPSRPTLSSKAAAARKGAADPVKERAVWLERLPETIAELARRWSLTLGTQLDGNCAWVAAVTRADGTSAVLKLGMPHMEGEQEIDGLRFWDGDPRSGSSKRTRISAPWSSNTASRGRRCVPGRSPSRIS